MSDLDRLERFLRTDPRDIGCDEAMAALHVYVDLTAAGVDGPCSEDFAGLLLAVTDG
jgi:hypothetical protein